MRTTVSLPDPLLDNAKEYAAERGITLSAVLEDALRCLLASNPAPSVRSFRLRTVRGRPVNPDLDLDRTSGLLAMDDEASFSGKRR